MNSKKIGQPYIYPNSMIEFLGIIKSKGFDYRSLQGMVRALSKRFGPFPVISYSQIRRRTKKLELSFKPKSENLAVGCDGIGVKVTNRGEWIRQKWKVRRGWIKVVIMGDISGDIVDIRIENENLDERSASRGMIRKNKGCIDKVLMDGLHDCEDTFNLCKQENIEPAIEIRENATGKGMNKRAEETRPFFSNSAFSIGLNFQQLFHHLHTLYPDSVFTYFISGTTLLTFFLYLISVIMLFILTLSKARTPLLG
jgi:hypothetical protein